MKKTVSPATAAIIIVVVVVVVVLIGLSFVRKGGGKAPAPQTTVDIQQSMKMGPMGQKMPGGGPESPDAQIK